MITINEIQEIAIKQGGKCVSESFKGWKYKLVWECAEGHNWEATLSNVKYGKWCPTCGKIKSANKRRKTIIYMQELAAKNNGKCVSMEYINMSTKLEWECAKGHRWQALPSNISRGKWCPFCTGRYRTIKDMQDFAMSKGGKCISTTFNKMVDKLVWECVEGHRWEATPNSLMNSKSWCPKCASNLPKTLAYCKILALSKGGKCLSSKYDSIDKKLLWQCAEGHEFKISTYSVSKGTWCPLCNKNSDKNAQLKELLHLANLHKGDCLSTEYRGVDSKLVWQCAKGHIWESTPYQIKKGSWCPRCTGRVKTIEDMQKLAQSKGGKCLSEVYINNSTKLTWQCNKGHKWKAIYNSVKRGTWCPTCNGNKTYSIEDMREIAKKKQGQCLSKEYKNLNTKLKWQCAVGHVWEAIPSSVVKGTWCKECLKPTIIDAKDLAITYQGECLSSNYIDSKSKLKWRCKEGHVWEDILGNIKRGRWCPKCKKLQRELEKELKLNQLKQIASNRGGKCISQKYENVDAKLIWQCNQGHTWESSAYSIKTGAWCSKCAAKKNGDKLRGTIDEMHKIARERNGTCLSEEYIDSQSLLEWECSEGHTWKSNANNIKNGNWCKICSNKKNADRQRNNINKMKTIAASHGGYCLSKKYVNAHTKLLWKCSEGHIWGAKPNNIQQGKWCPECALIENGLARRKYTFEEIAMLLKENLGDEYKLIEFISTNNPIKIFHETCGKTYETHAGNAISRGSGCRYCSYKVIAEKKRKTQNQFEKEVFNLVEDEFKVISKYVSTKDDIVFFHNICRKEFVTTPDNFLSNPSCPICRESVGEARIRRFLESFEINFKSQRRFSDCRDVNPLAFDFALTDSKGNVIGLIEYDGKQHFESIDFFGGEEGLKKNKVRDEIKNKYCINNQIPLLRIPYWEQKDIEMLLWTFIYSIES